MPESARGENRDQSQPGIGLGHDGDGFGKRHLTNIKLLELGEAEKHFLHRWMHGGDVDARCIDNATHQVAHMVVVAQSDRELNVHACMFPKIRNSVDFELQFADDFAVTGLIALDHLLHLF